MPAHNAHYQIAVFDSPALTSYTRCAYSDYGQNTKIRETLNSTHRPMPRHETHPFITLLPALTSLLVCVLRTYHFPDAYYGQNTK